MPRTEASTPGAAACVMEVEGAHLDTDPTEQGMAIAFHTSNRASIGALRDAVAALAATYREGADSHAHRSLDEAPHASAYHAFDDAEVRVTELADGARIELVASDARRLGALRERVRAEATMMRRGACPIAAAPVTTAGL